MPEPSSPGTGRRGSSGYSIVDRPASPAGQLAEGRRDDMMSRIRRRRMARLRPGGGHGGIVPFSARRSLRLP